MHESGLTPEQLEMAAGWYGYGRWDAPFWFVGLEPGGDELDACVRMWHALGKAELLDIAARHDEHDKDWFSERATTQQTWAKLIWLLLAYHGIEPSREATLSYQKKRLGRKNEETAILEISCIPARHNGIDVPRELFREERVATIRQRMIENKPQIVVFYSPDMRYRKAWNEIAGMELERDVPIQIGPTTCVMTYHPNGEWSKAYWAATGRALRDYSMQIH